MGGDVVVSAHAALRPASKSTVSFQRPALRFVGPRLGVLGSSLLRVAKPGEDKGLGSVASCTALGSVAGQRGLQSAGPSWGPQCWCPVPIRRDLTTQRRRTDMLPPRGPALNLRAWRLHGVGLHGAGRGSGDPGTDGDGVLCSGRLVGWRELDRALGRRGRGPAEGGFSQACPEVFCSGEFLELTKAVNGRDLREPMK